MIRAPTKPETTPELTARDATIRRVCEAVPGLYAFVHRGIRQKVIADPDFPVRSLYAMQVLNGDKLNDDASGSFRMTQLRVIEIAKRHGLRIVVYEGDNYWHDDAPIAATKLVLSSLYGKRRA